MGVASNICVTGCSRVVGTVGNYNLNVQIGQYLVQKFRQRENFTDAVGGDPHDPNRQLFRDAAEVNNALGVEF